MTERVKWEIVRTQGTVLIGQCTNSRDDVARSRYSEDKIKVAVIDLNKTLIVSKSGVLHGIDENDWRWCGDNVPGKIRALHDQGYVVVITTNQGRLTDFNGNESAESKPFKKKMELVLKELGVPATLFAACANDIYRKPRPGIWSLIPTHTGNEGCTIDKGNSFVVGDAAGRENDHSDSDLHLALNFGVDFYTPEVFFQEQDPQPVVHKFDPGWYLTSQENVHEETHNFIVEQANDPAATPAVTTSPRAQSLIVLIGLPGAGKTTFYNRSLAPLCYKRVTADVPGAEDACVEVASRLLTDGFSVVIDNVNVDSATRKPWILLAKKHKIQAQTFFLDTSVELCLHNDSFRALAGPEYNPEQRPIFPRIPFLDLAARLEKPTPDEGFDHITVINFMWHGTHQVLEIWKRFWH